MDCFSDKRLQRFFFPDKSYLACVSDYPLNCPVMRILLCCVLTFLLTACDGGLWNNPYPVADQGKSIFYGAFGGRPKHLDPAQSYSENEYLFITQIYTPPLQYHYLKRPYQLTPLAASQMPTVTYLDRQRQPLPQNALAEQVAYSVYTLHIKPGMRYQPHPMFARDDQGEPRYFSLSESKLEDIYGLNDFAYTGTRELQAADFVHQIKRLAHPGLHSPIQGIMAEYIVGLDELVTALQQQFDRAPDQPLDLTRFELSGVKVLDVHSYQIEVKGKYPQFAYWLAMPFFSPMPPEADVFYAQPGMKSRNLVLDWWPVGSGPYYLSENDPNRRMVLTRNPYYDSERYPAEGAPGDAEAGLLDDAGQSLPLIDQYVFTLEKEAIPTWNKFLQGYYDSSGISSDSFDQAVQIDIGGEAMVSDAMRERGIVLSTAVSASTMFTGFNWLDETVGGDSERARKLRLAIAIAVDYEEFISIFRNGRGIPAYSPIPPGLFGYRDGEAGINPYVYDWVDGQAQRKPISEARKLLAEAGYPGGIDEKTGKPLVISLDTTSGGMGDKALADWVRKQFQKIDVQLEVRSTDWNRFQDKIRKGNAQLFYYGWNADYPDPENFLFLLHGEQAKVAKQGSNSSNYLNPEYDTLFEQMKNMENGPERQQVIDRMLEILHYDSPWLWGFHPKDYVLRHGWVYNTTANAMENNKLKYWRIDVAQREQQRQQWNQPSYWPLALLGALMVLLLGGLWRIIQQREAAR